MSRGGRGRRRKSLSFSTPTSASHLILDFDPVHWLEFTGLLRQHNKNNNTGESFSLSFLTAFAYVNEMFLVVSKPTESFTCDPAEAQQVVLCGGDFAHFESLSKLHQV